MRKCLFSLTALLLLVSCGGENVVLKPGQLYLINTTRDSGCAVFTHASNDGWEGVYYASTGSLFADKRKVTFKGGRELILVDPSGSRTPVVSYSEYEEPPFTPFPKTWEYRDSVYAVRDTLDVPYAKAKGYWSTFPDTGESNLQIFLSKVPDLKKTDLELTMDVYLPEDGGAVSRPLLVLIHGGAFFNGDKASLGYPEWGRYFASMGYVVASVNYRLGFHLNTISVVRAGVRAVQDVNAAIFRIIHDADIYGVDPERVFVAGTSAGAITALNTAFMKDENIPDQAKNEGGLKALNVEIAHPFSIRAVGNMWGAVEDTTILSNSNAAIVSIHSTGDPIVPYGQDHPFEEIFGNKVIFPTMYGSSVITYLVGSSRAALYPYDLPGLHTLHIDKDSTGAEYLNSRFSEIKSVLRDFFADRMLPHPVKISQGPSPNVFSVDATDVASISWRVDGGIFLQQGKDEVKVLFFPDSGAAHSVTASGEYKSGLTFSDSVYF